ncbi:hypothetical protein BU197_24435 [Streptomyces sp. CBMA291]|nr:hypothetical protein [Streptomyces sp. CBMA291]MBD0713473.1 hypothetical protein [Streptomyces sp. CBMA370]
MAVIGGLLFLALAYFAFGQAAVTRSGAQTAADAAALAAAQDARDQLRDRWLDVLSDPGQWEALFEGKGFVEAEACERAAAFAARNGADLLGDGCTRLNSEDVGFKVTVRSVDAVGRSVIPITESQHAVATAEAVIVPRCTFDAPLEPSEDPGPTPGEGEETPEEPEEPEESEPIVGLVCGDVSWVIDPEDPVLPDAADLFRVRLID